MFPPPELSRRSHLLSLVLPTAVPVGAGVTGGGVDDDGPAPVTHLEVLPARAAGHAPWPTWADPTVVEAFRGRGAREPFTHQIEAAEHAHAGRHVVLATGTASGKSMAYQLQSGHTYLLC